MIVVVIRSVCWRFIAVIDEVSHGNQTVAPLNGSVIS